MTEMKKYNHYTFRQLLAYSLIFLSACSADKTGEVTGEIDTTERPLTIAARMETEVTTRTTTVTTIKDGSIGVFRTTTNGYDALNNIPYTWNAYEERWISADVTDKTKTVYVDYRDADIYAYYPYDPFQTGSTFALSMKRYTPESAIFYAQMQQVNNRTGSVTFAMKPGYSRITFRVLNRNLSNCIIQKFKIDFDSNVNTTGSIDISTANPSADSPASPITTYDFLLSSTDSIYNIGIEKGKWDETVDLLMIPGQSIPEMTITAQLTLKDMMNNSVTTSVTIPSGAIGENLIQGRQYIIPLIIQGTAIIFDTNKVPGLGANTDKDPYNDNELTAYTLPPVKLSENLQVATGNLYYYTSKLIAASKNPNYILDGVNNWYCFAARNGQMWPEINSTANYEFAFSPTMDDYCKRINTHWKMPTGAQLQELADLPYQLGTCDDGGTVVSGYWIGTYKPEEGSRQKNAIFLTEGKYLDNNDGYLLIVGPGAPTYKSSDAPLNSFIRCVIDK